MASTNPTAPEGSGTARYPNGAVVPMNPRARAPVVAVLGVFAQAFAFELGEHSEQLQHHPPGRGPRVDALTGGQHPHPERVQPFDQLE